MCYSLIDNDRATRVEPYLDVIWPRTQRNLSLSGTSVLQNVGRGARRALHAACHERTWTQRRKPARAAARRLAAREYILFHRLRLLSNSECAALCGVVQNVCCTVVVCSKMLKTKLRKIVYEFLTEPTARVSVAGNFAPPPLGLAD